MVYCKRNKDIDNVILYDRVLFWLMIAQILIGFIMVTSASMPVAKHIANDPFFFVRRDAFYITLSFFLSLITLRLSLKFWNRHSIIILIISIIMLIMVILIGHSVNGASRWIGIGSIHIQPAEFTKLSFFIYLSNYLMRKIKEVRNNLYGFIKPLIVLLLLSILLLAQPDFGSIIILLITTLTILFLAGVQIWKLITTVSIGTIFISSLIYSKSYRIYRIITFWDPWKEPFGSGYQLVQSLMAFGRGKIFGQGLGNSIQKLEYLPEAHTDFIFSIIGEELGYIGTILIILLIFFIPIRAISIGRKALNINNLFSGFLACSIGIWIGFQAIINIGATTGMLPIKGLTLPLISYGGSSLLVMSTAIIILIRIDYETRIRKVQAFIIK